MSQVKKIIVDSRYFVDNAPAGKGTFELAEIVEVQGSQELYLESFQCVNSWFTVDDSNCNHYIIEQGSAFPSRGSRRSGAPRTTATPLRLRSRKPSKTGDKSRGLTP